jgi:DNA-binding MarR family transcriptional regulator
VPPVPPHASSLAFLLSQVGAQSARLFAATLAELGVTPRDYGILAALSLVDGRSQRQLADELDIHRNNMVTAIDGLEAADWVRRVRDPADRRAFSIRLTPAGRDVVARVQQALPQLDSQVSGGLDEHQAAMLKDTLRHIASELGLRPGVHPSLSSHA